MADLQRRLSNHKIIGIDTSIFIYHFEAHSTYQPVTTTILYNIQTGQQRAIISTVALMELTVHPWRAKQPQVARHYEALLVHFPHLTLVDVTRDVARKAAQLRAAFKIRPADALHVASALTHQATAFVTNDKGVLRLNAQLDVILLDAFIEG